MKALNSAGMGTDRHPGSTSTILAALASVDGVARIWLREGLGRGSVEIRVFVDRPCTCTLETVIENRLKTEIALGVAYTLRVSDDPADVAAWVLEGWPG